MLKLIAIVGTNSKRSTNRQLLQYMQKHFADKAEIELVEIKDIPVFNKPADKQLPAEILEIAAKIEASDGVIIGTPEYDHSIPAVLMSTLAWLSYGIYPLLNKPIMITGDHQDTAEAIAKRLGIIDANDTEGHVLTGAELNELSDEDFEKVVGQYSVYARVSPEHKVRIVKAWQKQGKVVAMTGDGVNDAPALKTADIGIGMGITGTEVSKGASDMILADDNFATIIVAVEEGRKVFSNIQKTIQYLLSANTAEVLTIFLSTLFGWDVLQPVHLLWINLVTDTFPAIALGVEPAEPGVMNHKPRGRKASFFSGGVLSSIIYQGVLQAAIVMSVYGLAIAYPVHVGDNHAIHADALTMAFATLGLIQLFHAYNVKSVYQSILTVGPFKSKTFNWSILVSFILLMATIVVEPLEGIFHVTKLDLSQWVIVMGGSFSMILIVEIVKFVQRKLGLDKNAI